MLKIRFQRTGKKNQPFFRIVVTEKNNPPRGGRFLELLGFFNPQTKEKKLKAERIKHWLSVGAKASPRVHNLLISEKVIEGKKIDVHKKPKKKKGESTSAPEEASEDKSASAKAPEGKEERPAETKEESKEEVAESAPKPDPEAKSNLNSEENEKKEVSSNSGNK